jgi:hypothetical protein
MEADELRVREETQRKLRENPEAYLAEYTSKFGSVLNADDAATLFDEYNQDPAKYRVAVHPAATWIRAGPRSIAGACCHYRATDWFPPRFRSGRS